MTVCAMTIATAAALATEWTELKGDHFIIYYVKEDAFAKETLRYAEGYYSRIASDLGYARVSNFWQWDNRVKIYIYPTEEEYVKISGEPAWSKGVANYTKKEITSFVWSKGFQESLLPHEIGHLIFRDFVGFKGEVPLWLDEGVAQWQEPSARRIARRAGRQVVTDRQAVPFTDFTKTIQMEGKSDKEIRYFYMQALSVVDYMIGRHGTDAFSDFCRQLRDGKSLDEALRFAYPSGILNLDDLQEKWIKYVTEG